MRSILAIIKRNLTNFTRDKMKLFFSIFMGLFFLFIFSFVMKSTTTGMKNPMNYLISGIIIMTVFQTALNNSMGTIEDVSSGFMKEILVAPISRWQISIGQVISSTIISVLQGSLVVITGLFLGLKLDVVRFFEMEGVMILAGAAFSSMGLYLATLSKNSATFQIMISIIAMPLTFLSGAYIPTTAMPSFIRPIVYINPLTYTTAIFRYISLKMGGFSSAALLKSGVAFKINGLIIMPYVGLFMIIFIGIVFLGLCVYQFNKADFSRVKVFKHHH